MEGERVMPQAPRKPITAIKPRITTLDTRRGSSPAVERITGRPLQRIRDRIGQRDEYTCQGCGRLDAHGLVDHTVPLHLGGAESDENRQWLCDDCHRIKSEREEKERGNPYALPGRLNDQDQDGR